MTDLIARLESAEGPCRELDAEIITAIGTHVLERRGRDKKAWFYKIGGADYERLDPNSRAYGYGALPRYTSSVDAALTLVPEGLAWALYGGDPNCDDSVELGPVPERGCLMDVKFTGEASTPALALVIAALRAKGVE